MSIISIPVGISTNVCDSIGRLTENLNFAKKSITIYGEMAVTVLLVEN